MSLLEKGKSPIGKSYQMSRLWAYWPTWLPKSVAGATQPMAIRSGVLYIWVKNSTWMYELNFNKQSILEKIQAHVGADVVQEIRFTLDLKTLPPDLLQNQELRDFITQNQTGSAPKEGV